MIDKKIPVFWCALILVMPALVVSVSAETVELELKRVKDQAMYSGGRMPENMLIRWTFPRTARIISGNSQSDEFAEVIPKEPTQYQFEKAARGIVEFSGNEFGFVLDSTHFEQEGYNRLIFDLNRNGDLTDDKEIQARPLPDNTMYGGGYIQREFPRIDVTLEYDGEEHPYSLFTIAVCNTNVSETGNTSSYQHVYFTAGAYYEGEIELAGKAHRIVITDFNTNGRFNDRFDAKESAQERLASRGMSLGARLYGSNAPDLILLDLPEKNQNFRGIRFTDHHNRHPLSDLLCIGGKFYDVEISPAGDRLTLTPSSIAVGRMSTSNENYDLLVHSDRGLLKVIGEASEPVSLPAGDWTLIEYMLYEEEPPTGGSPTFVTAMADSDSPLLKIKENETTEFKFGPPYKPEVTVSPRRMMMTENSGQQVQLEMKLIGSAGESCTNLMVNGGQPEPPTFTIATAGGEIVERGSFEYG